MKASVVGLLVVASAFCIEPLETSAAGRGEAGGAGRGVPKEIGLAADTNRVGRFEKIEFTLRIGATFQNPYDPEEADVRLEIATPGGARVPVPAFYFQPFEHRRIGRGGGREWLYPAGEPVWKARYAPTEAGPHRCTAMLRTPAGSAHSAEVAFDAVASTNRGFVRVAKQDGRYLECDDGRPFFAIGQNVAFVKDTFQTMEMIRKLGANGGNFARVWACAEDWGLALEARKSGWGRSWDWRPPFAMMPDREAYHFGQLCVKLGGEVASLKFEPSRPVALRPGTKYLFSGQLMAGEGMQLTVELAGPRTIEGKRRWTPFKIEFTAGPDEWFLGNIGFRLTGAGPAWLREMSLREAAGGAELLTEADPNRPALGVYNQADCFMLDQIVAEAERSGVRLQVVLLTRDHYMAWLRKDGSSDYNRALASARKLVRYSAARWGYSTHVAAWEYFNENDPGLPTERFHAELAEALDEVDVNRHLRTTSAWHSPAPHYAQAGIDQADMHFYLRPPNGESWKDEVASVLERWQLMREKAAGKPAIFAEFGITDKNWQRAPELDRDREFTHLHNALWTSALAGFASTVCHWYWDDIQKRDLYPVYQPLARFVADIPFNGGKVRPAAATNEAGLRVVGQQTEDRAWLWIFDPNATWWKVAMEGAQPAGIRSAVVRVTGLPAGRYEVTWWDTREGRVLATTQATLGTGEGVTAPEFRRDIACRIAPLR